MIAQASIYNYASRITISMQATMNVVAFNF